MSNRMRIAAFCQCIPARSVAKSPPPRRLGRDELERAQPGYLVAVHRTEAERRLRALRGDRRREPRVAVVVGGDERQVEHGALVAGPARGDVGDPHPTPSS